MRILTLVPIGRVERSHLTALAEGVAARWGVACSVHPDGLDAGFAYNPLRGQYHSTEILKRLVREAPVESWRVLGVTEYDLYIPILTFVFGEAQVDARGALVSLHRLRQEFYGLPANQELLNQRLLKESIHELGHTLGLRHCTDYRCAMSPSHAVEKIDVKFAEFCKACTTAVTVP